MIRRPLRIHWHDNDTPGALKEAYQSQTDINIRTPVPPAVDECLSSLESDPERMKSLVSWEWIRRNVQELSEDYAASLD